MLSTNVTNTIHGILPSPPLPLHSPTLRKMGGDDFIEPWGTLKFYLPLEGLSQMGGKIFYTFGGGTRFSLLRGWAEFLLHRQKYTHPSPTRKSPPSRLTPKLSFPHQRFIPQLNNNFHVITQ